MNWPFETQPAKTYFCIIWVKRLCQMYFLFSGLFIHKPLILNSVIWRTGGKAALFLTWLHNWYSDDDPDNYVNTNRETIYTAQVHRGGEEGDIIQASDIVTICVKAYLCASPDGPGCRCCDPHFEEKRHALPHHFHHHRCVLPQFLPACRPFWSPPPVHQPNV